MIFIPKYPIIEAFEVADTLETFSNQLMDLNIPYSKIVCDKQTIDNKIVEGYTIHSKNDKNFVFVQKGSLIFSKDGILHIIEDMDAFISLFYEKHEIPKEILVPEELDQELLSNALNTKVLYVTSEVFLTKSLNLSVITITIPAECQNSGINIAMSMFL